MRILVTNDDGIYAPGLAALAEAVAPLGEVQVVALGISMCGIQKVYLPLPLWVNH